jgi:uncharacterized protein YjeT (DUF2065 family)
VILRWIQVRLVVRYNRDKWPRLSKEARWRGEAMKGWLLHLSTMTTFVLMNIGLARSETAPKESRLKNAAELTRRSWEISTESNDAEAGSSAERRCALGCADYVGRLLGRAPRTMTATSRAGPSEPGSQSIEIHTGAIGYQVGIILRPDPGYSARFREPSDDLSLLDEATIGLAKPDILRVLEPVTLSPRVPVGPKPLMPSHRESSNERLILTAIKSNGRALTSTAMYLVTRSIVMVFASISYLPPTNESSRREFPLFAMNESSRRELLGFELRIRGMASGAIGLTLLITGLVAWHRPKQWMVMHPWKRPKWQRVVARRDYDLRSIEWTELSATRRRTRKASIGTMAAAGVLTGTAIAVFPHRVPYAVLRSTGAAMLVAGIVLTALVGRAGARPRRR